MAAILVTLMAGCSREPAEHSASASPAQAEAAMTETPSPNAAASNASAPPEPTISAIAATSVPDLPENEVVTNGADEAMPFPDEVTDFMVARDGCDHFRGEESYDAERRAFLESSVRTLCKGTDAKLAELRKRYAKDGDVMLALQAYEDRIEGQGDRQDSEPAS